MRFVRRSAVPLLMTAGVFALGALDSSASADEWRLPRRDAGRTGAAAGTLPLDAPAVKWRSYLGGRPTDGTVRFGLNGASLLVTNVGGRFVARDAETQATLWSSALLGAGTIADIADLDDDGSAEVIVQTTTRAYVLSGATGAVTWASPADTIQIMGAVRVLDLNGDGVADLYLDNGVGAKPGTQQAAAYTFGTGSAQMLWSIPFSPAQVNAGTDALVDLDQDGTPEALLAYGESIEVIDASTGNSIGMLAPPSSNGQPYAQATALAADLDGSGALEVLVLQPNAAEWSETRPGLAAYQVDVSTGQSSLLFAVDAGSTDAEVAINADVATDLDGDGVSEIVFSYRSSATGDAWTTEILSGMDGSVIDSISDARFEGSADLDQQAGSELVVATSTGLRAYGFASGSLQTVGNLLPGMRALTVTDGSLRAAGSQQQRLAVVPGVGGQPVLMIGQAAGDPNAQASVTSFDEVRGVTLFASAFSEVGSYEPAQGVVTGAMRADFSTRPYEQIALGTSEGFVAVLSRALQPTNGVPWLGATPVGTFVGGGAIGTSPLAASDAEGPFVVLPGTAVGTVVADARGATMVEPPLARWWAPSLGNVSVIDFDGETQLIGFDNQTMLARRTTDGLVGASASLPHGWPWGSALPLSVAGQSNPRIGIDWRVDGSQIIQTAVDLDNGTLAWTGAPQTLGGYFGSSAGDLDSDGNDEWFSLSYDLVRRNAATGASTVLGSFPQLGYALPLVAPFQGTTPQLLLQAGFQGPKLLQNNAAIAWEGVSPEGVNGMTGTRAVCGGTARFITPAVQSSYVRAYDGATGALLATRSLAGGQTFASAESAAAAGFEPGTLGHVSSVEDLAGSGPTVFVGSNDGHLYALDACSLDLRWAADLGASLGEPVIANVDDDADNELMVAAADGYLYALDLSACAAPTISLAGDDGSDVCEYAVGSAVDLSWEEVDGALSYEIALVTPDQKPVWTPAFKPVNGTTASVSLAGALAGRPYQIVVRGIAAEGKGAEAFSKPIVVSDTEAPQLTATVQGGAQATFTLETSDNLALDHYLFAIDSDDIDDIAEDGLLSGTEHSRSIVWTPPESLFGSELTLSVSVVDSAGLKATKSFEAAVSDEGVVVMKGDAPGDDPIGEPGDEPGEPQPKNHFGAGGCSSAGGASGYGTAFALGLLGLAAATRKRRVSVRRQH